MISIIIIIATRTDLVQFWILCAPDSKNISDTLNSAIVVTHLFYFYIITPWNL